MDLYRKMTEDRRSGLDYSHANRSNTPLGLMLLANRIYCVIEQVR